MKTIVKIVLIVCLAKASSAFALPMLSADGSTLTGVAAGGSFYDVMFGDGFPGTVLAGTTFDEARRAEAHILSGAIVSALAAIGGVAPSDINGCGDGVTTCNLINPEATFRVKFLTVFADNTAAVLTQAGPTLGGNLSVTSFTDTTDVADTTLVTYRLSENQSVPVPATLALSLLGLGALCLGRSRRAA